MAIDELAGFLSVARLDGERECEREKENLFFYPFCVIVQSETALFLHTRSIQEALSAGLWGFWALTGSGTRVWPAGRLLSLHPTNDNDHNDLVT